MPLFHEDVDAFAQALPLQHPGVIIDLARVPWPSPDHRDDFIYAITGKVPGDG